MQGKEKRRRRGVDEEEAILQLGLTTMWRQKKSLYSASLRFIHLHCPLFLSELFKFNELLCIIGTAYPSQ